ncbi:MAG: hypothetical protein ACYC7E_05655 [Armatimonadota bacterium]
MKQFLQSLLLVLAVLAVAGQGWAVTFRSTFESIKTTAVPGQVINRSFQLTLAKEEAPTRFRVHVEDWWRSEDGKHSFFKEPGTLKHSCAPWVVLNPTEAMVAAGGTLDVRVTITVPRDSKPGGYWCALTADQVPDPLAPRQEGVRINYLASVSVGIFINVGTVKKAATVQSVRLEAGTTRVILRNDGDCALGVEGRVEFIPAGATKPAATLPFARTTVLPEPITTALLAAALPASDVLAPGRYLVRIILDIGLDHYIGVQKELEITREMLSLADNTTPPAAK